MLAGSLYSASNVEPLLLDCASFLNKHFRRRIRYETRCHIHIRRSDSFNFELDIIVHEQVCHHSFQLVNSEEAAWTVAPIRIMTLTRSRPSHTMHVDRVRTPDSPMRY